MPEKTREGKIKSLLRAGRLSNHDKIKAVGVESHLYLYLGVRKTRVKLHATRHAKRIVETSPPTPFSP